MFSLPIDLAHVRPVNLSMAGRHISNRPMLRPEMHQWCDNHGIGYNLSSPFGADHYLARFDRAEDAAAFGLHWGLGLLRLYPRRADTFRE